MEKQNKNNPKMNETLKAREDEVQAKMNIRTKRKNLSTEEL